MILGGGNLYLRKLIITWVVARIKWALNNNILTNNGIKMTGNKNYFSTANILLEKYFSNKMAICSIFKFDYIIYASQMFIIQEYSI